MANSRKKKNFIYSLKFDDGVAPNQRDKLVMIYDHFPKHLGSYAPRTCKLNLNSLGWQPRSLMHLNDPVSESELESVIKEAHKEKAPGLDEFIDIFFSSCWSIIKEDIQAAVNHFLALN
jgi:hypothetical protein